MKTQPKGRSTDQARGAQGNRGRATPARANPASKPKPVGRKAVSKPKAAGSARPAPRPQPVRSSTAPPRSFPAVDPQAAQKQQQTYEEAVRLFQAQKYERAEPLFQKVRQGPNRALAHRAEMHARICQQRLHPPEVRLQTVEDQYNYAVTLINARRLPEATGHVQAALRKAPQADYLHYAFAAIQALQGNASGAYESLKTAIDLHPRNRVLARSDPDFAAILGYPPLASLLQIDRGSPMS
jgi:tetratricopeptide (TPR) repeat protein